MAIGAFHDGVIAVVFVTFGSDAISGIPMRKASRKERTIP